MSKIKSPSKKYLINRKEFPVTSSRKRKMDFGNRKISNLCPFLKQPFPVEGNVQFLDFEFVQNTKLTSSAFGVKILRVCFRAYSTKICIFHEIGNITQKQN